jgi:putative endonuclease
MPKINLEFGRLGEKAAVDFLKNNGYKIIRRNYKNKLGEIDIIAQEKDVLVFIEVKSRRTTTYGLPQEAVHSFKQGQMGKVALYYLKENNLLEKRARFDIISITNINESPQINLIRNAFELQDKYSY